MKLLLRIPWKDIVAVTFLVVIGAIVFHTWVFSFSPVTAGDWHLNDEVNLKEYFAPPNSMNYSAFGGVDIIGLSFYPFNFLTATLAHFGLTYSQALRFIFLYPTVFVGPISFYFLLRKLFKSSLAAFVGALLFQFNPYFMILDNGVLTLMVSCSLFPIIFLLYLKSLEKNSLKLLLTTGLVTYVASFYEIRGLYLMAPLLIGYALYHIFIIKRERTLRRIAPLFTFYMIPLIVVILLSLYWIFGLLAMRNPGYSHSLFKRALFGEGYMSATSSLAYFHPFWAGDYSTNFVTMQVPLRFWILPLTAILGFWVNRRHKQVLFFGIVAFMAMLLVKQSEEPFGGLYKWLFLNIPGFSAFRESSKFFFYTAVGYSVLIAGLINYLVQRKSIKWKLTLGAIVACLLIVAAMNARGQFTGRIRGLSVLRSMPRDYEILKQYILDQNHFFRILWLPYYSRWIPQYPNNPKLAANSLYYSPWNLINPDKPMTVKESEADRFAEMLMGEKSQRLLDISGVKYLVVPMLDKQNDDDFFYLFNKPQKFYIEVIEKIPYLKPVAINTQEVKVYLNQNAKPKIYLTAKPESISEDIAATPVNYTRLSASEYLLTLGEISSPMYLQFSQAFDANWKIFKGTDSWPNIFTANPVVNPAYHEKNIASFNVFKIDSSTSGETLKLYYFPQAYVILGWILSIAIGLFIIIFIITPNSMLLLSKIKVPLKLK